MMAKLSAAMLAATGLLLVLCGKTQAEDKATRVAICNLTRLYQECAMSKDRRAELEVLRAKAEGQLQEYRKKIETIERELPLYEDGSPEHKERKAKIEALRTEGQAKKRVETAHLEKKFGDFLKEFHGYALEGIEAVAEEKNYDIVLQITNLNLAKFSKPEPLLSRIFTQQVLHADGAADVTDAVMQKLDADYEKEKGEKAEE